MVRCRPAAKDVAICRDLTGAPISTGSGLRGTRGSLGLVRALPAQSLFAPPEPLPRDETILLLLKLLPPQPPGAGAGPTAGAGNRFWSRCSWILWGTCALLEAPFMAHCLTLHHRTTGASLDASGEWQRGLPAPRPATFRNLATCRTQTRKG